MQFHILKIRKTNPLNFRVQVVFSFQYFGNKDIISNDNDIRAYLDHVESTFNIHEICNEKNEAFANTVFVQDIGLVIR